MKLAPLSAVQPTEIEKAWAALQKTLADMAPDRMSSSLSVAEAKAVVREMEVIARRCDDLFFAYALEASRRTHGINPVNYRSIVTDAIEGDLAFEIIRGAEDFDASREENAADMRRDMQAAE